MTGYRYADWLKTHAKKKTIMEKLERSLVPFQLFAAIDFARLHAGAAIRVNNNGKPWDFFLSARCDSKCQCNNYVIFFHNQYPAIKKGPVFSPFNYDRFSIKKYKSVSHKLICGYQTGCILPYNRTGGNRL